MGVPWLAFIGFTTAFSALFAKTWRINKLFNEGSAFSRNRVSERDVLIPFFILLTANVVVLILWTLLDPLMYQRKAHPGTDGWNRAVSTYGSCQSKNSLVPFILPLIILNLVLLIIANWQAYNARLIESEFSESTYIGFVMAILLQAVLTGVPLLFLIRELPQAYYVVLISMVFVVCMAILLLIFLPKMVATERFRRQPPDAQARQLQDSVRISQQRTSGRRASKLRQSASQAPRPVSGQSLVPQSHGGPPLGRTYCPSFAPFQDRHTKQFELDEIMHDSSSSISGENSSRQNSSLAEHSDRPFSTAIFSIARSIDGIDERLVVAPGKLMQGYGEKAKNEDMESASSELIASMPLQQEVDDISNEFERTETEL